MRKERNEGMKERRKTYIHTYIQKERKNNIKNGQTKEQRREGRNK